LITGVLPQDQKNICTVPGVVVVVFAWTI